MPTTARRSKGSFRGSGWDAIKPPIPGNVFACMEELAIVDMRQKEDEIEGKCPMHFERIGKEDRHSSWSVNADEGFFNCFSCGYRGPFVILVRDVLDISFEEAAAWIRQRGVIERARRTLAGGVYVQDIAKGEIDTSKEINEANLALYTEVPEWACETRDLDPEMVDAMGVLWEPSTKRWILPIREPETGTLWGWQEKGKDYFRNRPRSLQKGKTLFGLDVFEAEFAVLVESPLDSVRVNTALGDYACLGSMGANVTDAQIDLIRDRVDTLIVALDNPILDPAGAKASDHIRLRYAKRGLTIKFFNYDRAPQAKDPGDKMTDEQIQWGVENAVSSILARFS